MNGVGVEYPNGTNKEKGSAHRRGDTLTNVPDHYIREQSEAVSAEGVVSKAPTQVVELLPDTSIHEVSKDDL